MFPTSGLPYTVSSDQGTHFTGKILWALLTNWTSWDCHCPCQPQLLGKVSRTNGNWPSKKQESVTWDWINCWIWLYFMTSCLKYYVFLNLLFSSYKETFKKIYSSLVNYAIVSRSEILLLFTLPPPEFRNPQWTFLFS